MEKEKEVEKLFTEEDIKNNFVPKEVYIELLTQCEKLTSAFNKLLKDYNDLHLTVLFQEETKK